MNIRAPVDNDLADIEIILNDTELFPPEMLDDMMQPFFAGENEQWLVCEDATTGIVGFSYTRPETLTDGTWNLLATGVRAGHQGQGYGEALLAALENTLP